MLKQKRGVTITHVVLIFLCHGVDRAVHNEYIPVRIVFSSGIRVEMREEIPKR